VTRAKRRATLSFEVLGRLVERRVGLGERFAADETLARLDARELDHAVAAAKASVEQIDARLAQAGRERDRTRELRLRRAATLEDVERQDATVESLRAERRAAGARLDEAERARDEAVLRAPFAGVVVGVGMEPGELAVPGAPVVEIAGDGPIEVAFEAPESLVSGLGPGTEVVVELPLAGREAAGRVASIGHAAAGPGRMFPVVIDLDAAEGVLAGMAAEVQLDGPARAGVSVPLSAVLDPVGGFPSIFVVDGKRARRVDVEVLGFDGDRVTLAGAVEPGASVVTFGAASLADGDRIEVGS